MKCGIKEWNQLIDFRNAKLKIVIHQFFVKCKNKNCGVFSKSWENVQLTILNLDKFFNMENETITTADTKLFSKKIVLGAYIFSRKNKPPRLSTVRDIKN